MTLGFFAFTRLQVDLNVVAAFLTIVGYSLNDTVVIYDRIRENLRKYRKMAILPLLNLSLNETLARTVVTSITVLIALGVLMLIGPEVIFGLAIAIFLGVAHRHLFVDLHFGRRSWSGWGSSPTASSRPTTRKSPSRSPPDLRSATAKLFARPSRRLACPGAHANEVPMLKLSRSAVLLLACAAALPLAACAHGARRATPPMSRATSARSTRAAKRTMDSGDYEQAAKLFDEVERQHPYSVWARRAQLMSAFNYYLAQKYTDAISSAQRFLTIHPGNDEAPYAQYLIAHELLSSRSTTSPATSRSRSRRRMRSAS